MALIHVNATGCLWTLPDGGSDRLESLLAQLPADYPVILMVHGFRYAPGKPPNDPHETILSATGGTDFGEMSWPRHLGIEPTDTSKTLGIAFGWQAGGTLWHARLEAARAGLALGALITRIRALSPGRRITALAHSLGAKVLFSAMPVIAPGDLSRAILLFPALLQHELDTAMAFPATRNTEIIHVTSRENRFFDLCNEVLSTGGFCRSIRRDAGAWFPSWVDLPLDCDRMLAHLTGIGFRIADRKRRICHWASYMRPGVFALYHALIAEPDELPLHRLTIPITPAPLDTSRGCGGAEFAVS